MSVATASPMRAVLDAASEGAVTLEQLAASTRLPHSVVSAVVEELASMGLLQRELPDAGCPATSCGGCPLSRSCSAPVAPGASWG